MWKKYALLVLLVVMACTIVAGYAYDFHFMSFDGLSIKVAPLQ